MLVFFAVEKKNTGVRLDYTTTLLAKEMFENLLLKIFQMLYLAVTAENVLFSCDTPLTACWQSIDRVRAKCMRASTKRFTWNF